MFSVTYIILCHIGRVRFVMAPIKEWFGCYNIIFSWFEEKYGYKALEEYWQFIAASCFDETIEYFRKEGLKGINDYFESIFSADGGEVRSNLANGKLVFEIEKCPDYDFLQSSDNPHFKPIKHYCRHHEIINSILAKQSGHRFCMTECSNNGRCKWEFVKAESEDHV